ncbi:response regulator [Tenacibaculum finnmarkense genomovar finnmarkense]|uniref:Response regulator n=1 Tax=Tenacibaculum finnmarkense genomovar finnmarkense TaxID=1458503 RepID=A0AAP1REQ7_9FLAO|nr:response regulator [Tenacibaculum finnmarkense]MBE7652650.1 response regulator [Tenacibaculum finnmarkense genomovar finnmarkense]MBE7660299.1 response regulator [Tenacibaculum finnmarkense genomovar finnmarkense]MBE7692742.1 response regulator [Tenacibaculum finnmarkense genomovar finnmarkense]MBE7694949.1 response regulator [Tenacibaculum finnmarkense genomovar finnmarkense]MCD8402852.1 response regulator [Tenacibaculum finnmarkense genomovar finnmarkense]
MGKKINVLLIEDTIIEIMKMKRTVSFLELQHTITEAKDAEIALKILEEKSNLPDLILLDLNMPKISGIEFLSIIKNDDALKHIPTVILTTSDNQKDLEECYRIGVSGYILKPLKYEDYVAKIEVVLSYWSINELKKY